jgi:hypothetical protein
LDVKILKGLALKPKESYNLYYAVYEVFLNCIKHSNSHIYIEINMPQIMIIGSQYELQKPINISEYLKLSKNIYIGQGLTLIKNSLKDGIKSYTTDYSYGMKTENFLKSFCNIITIK